MTEPTPWLDEEEQAAWRAFIEAAVRVTRVLDKELRDGHDLTQDDYAILAMLTESPEARIRLGRLATVLQLPKAHVTYRIGRLAQLGLVRRVECPTDARGVFAELTEHGRARLEEAAPTHVEGVRRHFLDHIPRRLLRPLRDALAPVTRAAEDEDPPGYY